MIAKRKRIRVMLLGATALVSLLLGLRSFGPLSSLRWARPERTIAAGAGVNHERLEHWVSIGRGHVSVITQHVVGLTPFDSAAAEQNSRELFKSIYAIRFGGSARPRVYWTPGIGPTVVIPGWAFVMIAGVLGFGAWWYSRGRSAAKLPCNVCGYERLGLAIDARCPECGDQPAVRSSGEE